MEKTIDRIDIKSFLGSYDKANTSQLKDATLDHKIVVQNYVPFMVKRAYARQLMEASHFTKDGGAKLDLTKQYLLETMALLDMYTNLEVMECEEKPDWIYDELNRRGLIDGILEKIPQTELKEWKRVLDFVYTGFYDEYFSMKKYLDDRIENLADGLVKVMDIIEKNVNAFMGETGIEDVISTITGTDDSNS